MEQASRNIGEEEVKLKLNTGNLVLKTHSLMNQACI